MAKNRSKPEICQLGIQQNDFDIGDFMDGSSRRKAYLMPNDLIITFHMSLRLKISLQHEKILIRTKVMGKNVSSTY